MEIWYTFEDCIRLSLQYFIKFYNVLTGSESVELREFLRLRENSPEEQYLHNIFSCMIQSDGTKKTSHEPGKRHAYS